MAKVIMVQGTMSGVGKSLLAAGLCRIFRRGGFYAAPFKSQNMALNSYITAEGLEMGRAQVMQAEAAGIEPLVCMNPILLKPTSHTGSQVIVNGKVRGNMSAREYFSYKRSLLPEIKKAFRKLESMADIIVIEGAGSPAEINLRENDVVNMGMAEMVDAPVLLAGDIDRGGVFAQLLGTLLLLSEEERKRIRGLVINKFRGDPSLLTSGIEMLEERGGVPVMGVVPYMEIALEDEDSLSERFSARHRGKIDIVVIRYPRISNFTDFNVFEQSRDVSVRYVTSVSEIGDPDLLFLPGSKNTMADLLWMRENGLEEAVKRLTESVPLCGICGGYQMLGMEIADPENVEAGGRIRGMGLLPVTTVLQGEKVRRQAQGTVNALEGLFAPLSGLPYEGYEIHMGRTAAGNADRQAQRDRLPEIQQNEVWKKTVIVQSAENKNVCGTYVHGIFDHGGMAAALVRALAERKNVSIEGGGEEATLAARKDNLPNGGAMTGGDAASRLYLDYKAFKETQYDKLADVLTEHLDMEAVYGMLREAHLQ